VSALPVLLNEQQKVFFIAQEKGIPEELTRK